MSANRCCIYSIDTRRKPQYQYKAGGSRTYTYKIAERRAGCSSLWLGIFSLGERYIQLLWRQSFSDTGTHNVRSSVRPASDVPNSVRELSDSSLARYTKRTRHKTNHPFVGAALCKQKTERRTSLSDKQEVYLNGSFPRIHTRQPS